MEHNLPGNNMDSTSRPHHSKPWLYDTPAIASMSAELDARLNCARRTAQESGTHPWANGVDMETQVLMMQLEQARKRVLLDSHQTCPLAAENGSTVSQQSDRVTPRVPWPDPASSSIQVFQRQDGMRAGNSHGVAGQPEQLPPPYSATLDPAYVPYQAQHLSPAPSQQPTPSTHLVKPIAIPATSAKLGSPFMRAYPPALMTYGVSRADFLGFLDDLNRCAVASPPAQILGLAGNIVSLVPLQTAQIVGSSVELAANLTTYGVSKGRTEVCLRAANTSLFAPRGLRAEIAKLSALAKIAGIPGVLDPATGKVNKKASMLAPIESLEEAQSQSAQHRRLQALDRWIAPLDLTPLPDIKQSSNALGKLHTMASERQRRKEEKKVLKDRNKAFEESEKASKEAVKIEAEFEKDMRKLDKEEREVRLKEAGSSRKLEKELAKIEKERAKLGKERDKDMGKLEEDRRKDDREEKGLRKILWLIIRDL